MRTTFLAIVLALLVITTANAKSNPLNSIRPLQMSVTAEDGSTSLVNYCTAWATIVREKRVWISAMHCVRFDDQGRVLPDTRYFIDGKPARLLAGTANADTATDVAIFEGGPSAEPLRVAFSSPNPLTPIWTSGYPFQVERQHTIAGIFGNIKDDDGFSFYNLAVAAGMSGAPVLTMDDLVIGVMRRSECPKATGWCPVSAGTPTAALRTFLGLD